MQFLFKTVDEEYEMMYSSIDDIPVEICRQFILSHVIREKWLSTDFEFENKGTLTGGSEETRCAFIGQKESTWEFPASGQRPCTFIP